MTVIQDRQLPSYQREIVELHWFFEDWFTGRLSKTGEAYARFRQVIAEDFTIIGPEGTSSDREVLLESLFSAHRQRPESHIWIENCELRQRWGDNLIVTYQEWQGTGDSRTARLSSVVFRQTRMVTCPRNLVTWTWA